MALYAISIRQARDLPPPFFRFCLTADTLGLSYILPAAGRIRDFHPLERALTGRTRTNPAAELLCGGVHLCAETAEMPDFKRFLGIEKVHHNSIKITVDLWSE